MTVGYRLAHAGEGLLDKACRQRLTQAVQDQLCTVDGDAVIVVAFITRHLGGTHTQAVRQLLLGQAVSNRLVAE